jgi:hypothetical protein
VVDQARKQIHEVILRRDDLMQIGSACGSHFLRVP